MYIETNRITIREFKIDDLNDLYKILSNPRVMRYSVHGSYTLAQTETLLKETISSYKKQFYGIYAVELKENQKMIGFFGLSPQEINDKTEIELGYRFAEEYWGNGFATEGAIACIHYVFENLNLERIISIIDPQNIGSVRVAEKAGLVHECEANYHNFYVHVYSIHK
ncbi:GNAT family N-acetyltransferase [Candidatus Berkiella cookevillensis]|uniref:Anhydro-N-acetylmuramic acid kinase n=1 Tax=Candidatus Berkiella cookevillensis TaxID=437022 RepID=A0A0Q9YNC2_9GAMM|nr:GNAT family N-acetyltransferase [Candidatus Berkiella cookevillensis]MCS5708087.1 GNAT family N-acetyltransferase [Candidatus Berkiella cookevillensis]